MEFSHTVIAEYVKRTQAGDSDAFAELYRITYSKVYNYARHYMHDEFHAQDAVQDIYISALKNIQKLNDPTLFVAWLNRIAFNVCFDLSKSIKAGYGEVDSEMLEEICDVKLDSNPEASVFKRDESERLLKAIDSLTPTERELITLRFFNSMKIDEIVNATGISRSTVKRQLNSATEHLKAIMKE